MGTRIDVCPMVFMSGSKLVRLAPIAIALAFLAMSLAPVASAAPAESPTVAPAATSDLCGTTILADLVLHKDMVCRGNGLVVGVDGITIDLNGHSIIGPGRAAPTRGITVFGRADVSIEG